MAPPPKHHLALEKKVEQHEVQIDSVTDVAQATNEKVEKLAEKHDKLKDDHGTRIGKLEAEVANLKDDVRFWRGAVVTMGSAIILALLGLLFKK